MKARIIRAVGVFVLLVTMPLSLFGQTPSPSAPVAPLFSEAQLDQLLAPVALYPDPLVAQILMAATYPLEVVEAARWVQDPNNARLTGDQLAVALQDKDWDPSVKALVPFPQILQMMNDRLDWMGSLGDAFLAQQSDVMNSVQRLRREAQNAGSLESSPQQAVTVQGQAIVIQPANPDVIYVPVYDPTVVYGAWPYPAYPPYDFPPPPGFVLGVPFLPGFWWGPVIHISFFGPFWGWSWFDWGHRSIYVDRQRYDRIPGRRPPVSGNTWQHDTYHRRGVAYRDPGTAARYGRPMGSPDAHRTYRGYESAPQVTPPRTPAIIPRSSAPVRRGTPGALPPRSGIQRTPSARQPTAPHPSTPRPPTVQRPATTIQQPSAPAFRGYQRGTDTRAESARGRASLQSTPPRSPPSSGRTPRPSGGGAGGGQPSGSGHNSGGGTRHR